MKQTFQDFLAEKHMEQYEGTKDGLYDAFNDWLMEIEVDDWIKYGDEYKAKTN